MAQTFFDVVTGGVSSIDGQTAQAVQSLLEPHLNVVDATQVEEDDVFQCGKCKKQFSSLTSFLTHKQTRCVPGNKTVTLQSALTLPVSNGTSAFNTSVPMLNKQQMGQYSSVPASPLSHSLAQSMVFSDDMLPVSSLDTQTLQIGSTLQGSTYMPQISPMTFGSAVTTGSSLSSVTPSTFSGGSSVYTSSIPSGPIQVQTVTIHPQALKPETLQEVVQQVALQEAQPHVAASLTSNTLPTVPRGRTLSVLKPSPSKAAGRKGNASLITMLGTETSDATALPKQTRRAKTNSNLVVDDPQSAKKRLRCQYCEKAFCKNFDLQQHIRSHTGEKPFQCIVCGRAFAQKSNVKKHMQTHKVWPHGVSQTLPPQKTSEPPTSAPESTTDTSVADTSAAESGRIDPNEQFELHNINTGTTIQMNLQRVDSSYVCQYCPQKFNSYFLLKTHMVEHKKHQMYKCILKDCGQMFSELDSFLEHTRTHDDKMQYRCHMCNKVFPSLYELGVHQYSHSLYPNQGPKPGPRYFRCNKCNNKYATPEALQQHMVTTSHKYTCTFCDKTFTCERYLRRHLTVHGPAVQYVCEVCHKGFKTEHYLKMHIVIHSSEKPFKCELCEAAFNRKDKLKRHMLIHDANKKYKCPFRSHTGCVKAFNRPDKLKAHILSHSGIKPFKCHVCGKTFKRRPHLREHENTHKNEYRFRCESCGRGFHRQKLFQTHKCRIIRRNSASEKLKLSATASLRRRRRKPPRERKNLVAAIEQGPKDLLKKTKGRPRGRPRKYPLKVELSSPAPLKVLARNILQKYGSERVTFDEDQLIGNADSFEPTDIPPVEAEQLPVDEEVVDGNISTTIGTSPEFVITAATDNVIYVKPEHNRPTAACMLEAAPNQPVCSPLVTFEESASVLAVHEQDANTMSLTDTLQVHHQEHNMQHKSDAINVPHATQNYTVAFDMNTGQNVMYSDDNEMVRLATSNTDGSIYITHGHNLATYMVDRQQQHILGDQLTGAGDATTQVLTGDDGSQIQVVTQQGTCEMLPLSGGSTCTPILTSDGNSLRPEVQQIGIPQRLMPLCHDTDQVSVSHSSSLQAAIAQSTDITYVSHVAEK